MKNKTIVVIVMLLTLVMTASAQKIYWGDSVPEGWNGKWPDKYLTVPERTNYERTASSADILEFIDTLRWNSDKVYLFPGLQAAEA